MDSFCINCKKNTSYGTGRFSGRILSTNFLHKEAKNGYICKICQDKKDKHLVNVSKHISH